MMKKLLIILLVFAGLTTQAQNDAKAVSLLNKLSTQLNSYKNIYAEFKYNLTNKKAGVTQNTKGKVTIEGDKFHAIYMGIDDIYDGVKRYQIIHENEEVNITKHKDADDFTPNKIFSFYKKGYRQKMDIKQKIKGRTIQYVKLIPMDSSSSENYILLGIDLKTYHIYNVIIKEKDGSTITLEITKFLTNQVLPGKMFTFSKEKYPDYYINDLD
jgi:outer membrane lipoprotein-sorting protein